MQAAGISRVVTRRKYVIDRVTEAAGALGIELATAPEDEATEARRSGLIAAWSAAAADGGGGAGAEDRVREERRERKLARRAFLAEKQLRFQAGGQPLQQQAASGVPSPAKEDHL